MTKFKILKISFMMNKTYKKGLKALQNDLQKRAKPCTWVGAFHSLPHGSLPALYVLWVWTDGDQWMPALHPEGSGCRLRGNGAWE